MGYHSIDHSELQNTVYFRPLAFNTKGRQLLKKIKQQQPDRFIPTLSRYRGHDDIMRVLHFDIISSNLYYYLQQTGPEQARKAIYVK